MYSYNLDQDSLFTSANTSRLSGNSVLKVSPNPSGSVFHIHISLPEFQEVKIRVTDLQGKMVRTLYSGMMGTPQNLVWNGDNNSGNLVRDGVYLICVETAKEKYSKKIVLLR
jgi:flagellar hook assembly protein FlgD